MGFYTDCHLIFKINDIFYIVENIDWFCGWKYYDYLNSIRNSDEKKDFI